MNKCEIEFIKMLKSFIYNQEYTLPKDINEDDFSSIYTLADNHEVKGIIWQVIKGNSLSPTFRETGKLRTNYFASLKRSIEQDFFLDDIGKIFCQNNIEYIPFKGISIKKHYPMPQLRTMGDIDIVVPTDKKEQAHSILLNNGYSFDQEHSLENVDDFIKNGLLAEVHNKVYCDNLGSGKIDYINYCENEFDFVIPTHDLKKEFTSEFHLVFLIYHMAKHFISSGIGIRFFMDILLFIKGNEIDYDIVKKSLIDLCLFRFAEIILGCCDYLFDSDILINISDDKISEDTLRKITDVVLARGVFGFDTGLNDDEAVGKLMMYSQKGKNGFVGGMFRWFFPTFDTIRKVYPNCEHKNKAQLMLMYPKRWINGIKKGRNPAKLVANKSQTDKYISFMNEIGLAEQ